MPSVRQILVYCSQHNLAIPRNVYNDHVRNLVNTVVVWGSRIVKSILLMIFIVNFAILLCIFLVHYVLHTSRNLHKTTTTNFRLFRGIAKLHNYVLFVLSFRLQYYNGVNNVNNLFYLKNLQIAGHYWSKTINWTLFEHFFV